MAQSRRPSSRSTGRPATSTRTAPAHRTPQEPEKELLSFVPEKFRSPAWIVVLLLSLIIFFGGVIFGGEYFASNDNISWESYRPYLNQMAEEGQSPQWMPYIFSGMPGVAAYMVTGERSWDVSMWALNKADSIFSFMNPDVMRVLFYYFILGMGVFFLARSKGLSRPISFFSSFAVIFSTWIIVWVMIGHNTKPMTLAFVPWVIIFLDQLIRRWSLLYAGLLILGVHFILESAHPQTAFYGALVIGIWMLSELIASIANKETGRTLGLGRAIAVGIVAAAFAYGMGMDRFNAVFEYNDYSTRGPASIIDTKQNELDAEQQYEYATNWSFDVDQTFTYVVPAYFGFGKMELEGITQGPQFVTWGNDKEPFTDAAHYMGIIVLLLGFYGAWHYRRNPFVIGMFAAGIVGLLLAYGGNMPLLYDFFYAVVPRFKQFRAPSQALVMLEFVFPILAGFGLQALVARRSTKDAAATAKRFLYGTGAAALFLLVGVSIKSMYVEAASPKFQGNTQVAEALYAIALGDWVASALVAAAFCLLAWAYLGGRIKGTMLVFLLTAITLIDLWRIDYRAMLENIPKEEAFAVFAETDVDKFLKEDTTQYRIADVREEIRPGLRNHPSYPAYHLHQHVGGYSAAKMRRYQDLMDVTAEGSTSMPGPGLAWDILNTKYILASQPNAFGGMPPVHSSSTGAGFVFENPNAMPRAWFVDRVETAEDIDVLNKIKANGFNPWEVAFVAEPLKETIAPPTVGGTSAPVGDSTADSAAPPPAARDNTARRNMVNVTSWKAHEIVLDVEATGTNFLVLSEIYYPVGWHATIDGKPVETIRTNYLLRGLVVPQGKHQIRFEYRDEAFESGKTYSLILNLLMLAAIAVGFVLERRNRESDTVPAPVADAEETDSDSNPTA